MRIHLLLTLLVLILLSGCETAPHLDNFDTKVWKADRYACQGQREALVSSLYQQRERLKGLNQAQIQLLLGKPDKQRLYERNQKFYYYYIKSGAHCQEGYHTEAGLEQMLQLRISAVDMVIELSFPKEYNK
ncbi:hypothetical protein [Eisenibacter elegans]|jgi:outer membrane protein assembly factor BamE (lipoprotein component of BamABCDE complex)|uniref:hypothetical protein n=1 Tax=Eisenibacter elegans TaxID=997 RepID=UPI0003FE6961|nr:hypothetical protein [Eisenibacter elegans]